MSQSINYDPDLTQLADLDRFVEAAADRVVRAVGDRDRWLAFDGNTWTANEAGTTARNIALDTITNKHASIEKGEKQAAYAGQRLTLGYPSALVRAAEQDPRLRKPVTDFDRETLVIGCANVAHDLRTGELHTGRPDLWVSRSTGLVDGVAEFRL